MPPVATPFFFYSLAGLGVLGGLRVIPRRNPVHSALALILAAIFAGVVLLLLLSDRPQQEPK